MNPPRRFLFIFNVTAAAILLLASCNFRRVEGASLPEPRDRTFVENKSTKNISGAGSPETKVYKNAYLLIPRDDLSLASCSPTTANIEIYLKKEFAEGNTIILTAVERESGGAEHRAASVRMRRVVGSGSVEVERGGFASDAGAANTTNLTKGFYLLDYLDGHNPLP